MRAIPWIFAWTQNRLMLPAWLGAHKGLQQAIDDGQKSVLDEIISAPLKLPKPIKRLIVCLKQKAINLLNQNKEKIWLNK